MPELPGLPFSQLRLWKVKAMLEMYRRLSSVDPDARSALLTVIDGPDFGDKCLLSSGELLWERDAGGFFARNPGAIGAADRLGVLELGGQRVFCEPLGREPQLVVCGGGHVSIPLIRVAKLLGLPVTVLEDRPAFAENARAAGADRVICGPFEAGLGQIPGNGDTFFAIVTRGHGSDIRCLEAISRKPHAYIGVIGSRRRVAVVKSCLIEERGWDPKVIDGIYMPIGLDIGAQTPEEIAVAIMAQIIQVRNRDGGKVVWPRTLLRAILDPAEGQKPRALACVVERRGSAPRGPGARMLIWPDGRTLGTVGGGLLEDEVIREACRRLRAGETAPWLHRAVLDAGAAAGEGMACGGEVTLLIEIIEGNEGHG